MPWGKSLCWSSERDISSNQTQPRRGLNNTWGLINPVCEKCWECWFWKPKQMVTWYLLWSIREANHGGASRMASLCYFGWFYQEKNESNQKEAPQIQSRETHFSQEKPSSWVTSRVLLWAHPEMDAACRSCGMHWVGGFVRPSGPMSSLHFPIFTDGALHLQPKCGILEQRAAPQPMDEREGLSLSTYLLPYLRNQRRMVPLTSAREEHK